MNGKLHARNTLVHILALYTNPERHKAHNTVVLWALQRNRQTDTMMPIADIIGLLRCAAVRSAKTIFGTLFENIGLHST